MPTTGQHAYGNRKRRASSSAGCGYGHVTALKMKSVLSQTINLITRESRTWATVRLQFPHLAACRPLEVRRRNACVAKPLLPPSRGGLGGMGWDAPKETRPHPNLPLDGEGAGNRPLYPRLLRHRQSIFRNSRNKKTKRHRCLTHPNECLKSSYGSMGSC